MRGSGIREFAFLFSVLLAAGCVSVAIDDDRAASSGLGSTEETDPNIAPICPPGPDMARSDSPDLPPASPCDPDTMTDFAVRHVMDAGYTVCVGTVCDHTYSVAASVEAAAQAATIECILLGGPTSERMGTYAKAFLYDGRSALQYAFDLVQSSAFAARYPEYVNGTNEQYVALLNKIFFNRASTGTFYLSQLNSHAINRAQLLTLFVQSSEFAGDQKLIAPLFVKPTVPDAGTDTTAVKFTNVTTTAVTGNELNSKTGMYDPVGWRDLIEVSASVDSELDEASLSLDLIDADHGDVLASFPFHAYFGTAPGGTPQRATLNWADKNIPFPSVAPVDSNGNVIHYAFRLSASYSTDPTDPTKTRSEVLVKSFGRSFTVAPPYKYDAAKFTTRYNTTYGSAALQVYDLIVPTSCTKPVPLMVLIHGGKWIGGDKADRASQAAVYLDTANPCAGYAVANVNYRLARIDTQSTQWPAQLSDVQLALKKLLTQPGIDKTRVAVLGDSAGGHLALMLGSTLDSPGSTVSLTSSQMPSVQAVVDEFGPADLIDFATVNGPLEIFGRATLQEDRDQYTAASPINLITPQSAPTYISQGVCDPVVPAKESNELSGVLKSRGVDFKYVTFTAGHEFSCPVGYNAQVARAAIWQAQHDWVTCKINGTTCGIAPPAPWPVCVKNTP